MTDSVGLVETYREFEPLLRRIVDLDPAALVRLRRSGGRLTALVRTPFQVLASRSVEDGDATDSDATVGAQALLDWLDGAPLEPPRRDVDWRWGVPPTTGWKPVDDLPDAVVRDLVRTGALTLKEAAAREGVPGAQPRAEVADALLDSVVLTVTNDAGASAAITLRTVSALVRLGFLARESTARVAIAGRWVRVAGAYGSVFAESAPLGLLL